MAFRLADDFVVRTPLLARDRLTTLVAQPSLPDGALAELFADPRIQEAIFLASPVLHDEIHRWLSGTLHRVEEVRRVQRSLLKYLLRMSTRATPFGLFAGCSTGTFAESSESGALEGADAIRRTTRLDMNLACVLANHLTAAPDIRPHLRLFPNSTLYPVGHDVRYYECRYDDRRRRHYELVSVEGNPYLTKVLAAARTGACIDDLARAIADADVSHDEATHYVNDLVDNQVLVSELEPAITDPRFLDSMIGRMPPSAGGADARETLEAVHAALQQLDGAGTNTAETYRTIRSTIARLAPEASLEAMFQVDYVRPARLSLGPAVRAQVAAGINALVRLTPRVPLARLETFRTAFRERFEDRQVPLLVAIDGEMGVPYGRGASITAPLLEGLDAGPPAREEESGPAPGVVEQQLLPRIWDALLAGQDEVRLREEDLPSAPPVWDDLPASCSVLFSVVPLGGRVHVALHGAGGATAAATLGRFAHLDSGICRHAEAIAAHDARVHEGKVVAEILHLPEDRVGNVLLHPPFRKYEIPCLARSTAQPDHVVALDELLLSVPHAGRFRLWSSRLACEVVPMLSNAHRYDAEELLPAYRLLCDLQNQDRRSAFRFPYEPLLAVLPRLPRIVYQDCVLSPARWWFRKARFAEFLERLRGPEGAFAEWQRAHRLPRRVLLLEHDYELYLDLSNAECRDLLASELRRKEAALFSEYLFGGEGAWINGLDGAYCHEVVASGFHD